MKHKALSNSIIHQMKRLTLTLLIAWLLWGMGWAQTNDLGNRALWASINGADNAPLGDYKQIVNRQIVNICMTFKGVACKPQSGDCLSLTTRKFSSGRKRLVGTGGRALAFPCLRRAKALLRVRAFALSRGAGCATAFTQDTAFGYGLAGLSAVIGRLRIII